MRKLIVGEDVIASGEKVLTNKEFLKLKLEELEWTKASLENYLQANENKNIEIAVNRIDTAITVLTQEITK